MEKSKNNIKIVKLNIGGQSYTTTIATLTKYPASNLARSINAFQSQKAEGKNLISIQQDEKSRLFIDRDGAIFRHILEYLRWNNPTKDWIANMIPSSEIFRLRSEAQFYGLNDLVTEIDAYQKISENNKSGNNEDKTTRQTVTQNDHKQKEKRGPLASKGPYYISIGCRGYYSAERDNPANDMTKFRKITRITVSGRSDVAKEVFSEELNESRDPERFPPYGYTCRYYLTHTYLEYAFETLAKRGFELVTSFSTGNQTLPSSNKDEFKQWSTYVEYLFYKRTIETK